MKKWLFLLKVIDKAGKLAFVFLFIAYLYLTCLLVDKEIGILVMIAACVGLFAAGKWLLRFLPELEELIGNIEAEVNREKGRERELCNLRIAQNLRPGT